MFKRRKGGKYELTLFYEDKNVSQNLYNPLKKTMHINNVIINEMK